METSVVSKELWLVGRVAGLARISLRTVNVASLELPQTPTNFKKAAYIISLSPGERAGVRVSV